MSDLQKSQIDKKDWVKQKNENRKAHDPHFVVIECEECDTELIVTKESPAYHTGLCEACFNEQ